MNRRKKKKIGLPVRTLIAMFAVTLLMGGAIGGTVAWLTSSSGEVKNTFTVGDIEIKLDEAKVDEYGNFLDQSGNKVDTINEADRVAENSYKIIPGNSYDKDPKVTFTKNSEPCYLFVTITKSTNYDTFLSDYVVDTDQWTKYTPAGVADNIAVYYREFENASDVENGKSYYILKCCESNDSHEDAHTNGCVEVPDTVTKEAIETIDDNNKPTLVFKACAVQLANLDLADAWTQASAKLFSN